ncbi:MAG: ribosome small subunit-dependent GTPase A [Acidimicrobiia bacterium]|nr:ribosome small subunit-dependent GTPase A [Acidimicrobiia bacterium]
MPDVLFDALVPLGWDDRVAALWSTIDVADAVPARVVRVERSACVVAAPDGDHVARAPTLPAVGDWVALLDDAVVGMVERWSSLARGDPMGEHQVLAANLDFVFVTAPADRLRAARVDREVAMAWEGGARPIVLVTKADLADGPEVEALRERLVGVDVVATSGVTGEGVDALSDMLRPHRTAALLGPSGAGKSTLANVLLGEDRLAVGDVRAGDHRGRHTTTSRQLVVVPAGGVLVDTPGLRSLALVSGDGVAAAFADIEALGEGCRFGDCLHDLEPGCAVVAAAEAGALDGSRLASYRKLLREVAFEERKADPRARKEQVRVWKARTKAVRRQQKDRGRDQ